MLGYSLTGLTREHALFFLYGLGANGKSVLINTAISILAEYHRTAPIEMLLASKHERHPTELAGLVGRRLVTATETEQGKRWAEAKIKTLTGSDPISARFMCKDFFDFAPRFKLVVAGNHKPLRVRPTRMPKSLTRLSEEFQPRSAERRNGGMSLQEPPRTTRRSQSPLHAESSVGAPS
jgi:P4 family phage/plasmid primase-like protien